MPCSLATSVITGSVEKAVWPVPASTVINQVTSGAREGNVLRVAAQHPFGEADQVIHPAGDLHGGDSGNHRHNDFNNVEGDRTRFNLKK